MALEGGILPKPATNGLGSCNLQTSGRAGGWHTKSPRPFFALPQFGVMRPFKARMVAQFSAIRVTDDIVEAK